jgi:hypothetical protein
VLFYYHCHNIACILSHRAAGVFCYSTFKIHCSFIAVSLNSVYNCCVFIITLHVSLVIALLNCFAFYCHCHNIICIKRNSTASVISYSTFKMHYSFPAVSLHFMYNYCCVFRNNTVRMKRSFEVLSGHYTYIYFCYFSCSTVGTFRSGTIKNQRCF